MKLLRLYILNCGVFENILLDFTDNGAPQNMLCFTGVNGTGKTTILELIASMTGLMIPSVLQGFNKKMPNVLTRTEFAQLDILIGEKILSIVLGDTEYIQKDLHYKQTFIIEDEIKNIYREIESLAKYDVTNIDFKNQINVLIESNKEKLVHLLDSFFDRKIIRENEGFLSEFFNLIEENLGKKISQIDLERLPLVYYFPTDDRSILDIKYKVIPKYDIKYDLVHRYLPSEDDLNALLVYYDYAYPEKFEDIKQWINTYVLTGKILSKIDRPEFKAIIKTDNGKEHGLELLSSGEENLLILAVQLYLMASRNTVFLIDEADQSLHPEYQEKLMTIIKEIQQRFNCQVLISTHSRHIWKFFKDKQIIRLTELIR